MNSSVERLEYGKFCESADGPVVQIGPDKMVVEHRILGMSPGFPSEVSKYCLPGELDVRTSAGERAPDGANHGTVLRPVVTPLGEICPVFYRLRKRGEMGEGVRKSRDYTLGRYLTSRSLETSPNDFLRTMDSRPLTGLTLEEASAITAIPIPEGDARSSGLAQKFAEQAVIFAHSGTPVAFDGPIPEADFYDCVTALWRLLPPKLRPLLSAGWGVGSSLSGRLAVSSSISHSSRCATFSAATGTWDDPAEVAVLDRVDLISIRKFAPNHLSSGTAYSEVLADHVSDTRAVQRTPSFLTADDLAWFTELPELDFETRPEWDQPSLLRAFRLPGLKALDELAFSRLVEFLAGPLLSKARSSDESDLNAQRFVFDRNRNRAFGYILEALSDVQKRPQADIALWQSLKPPVPALFIKSIEENQEAGRLRARLIYALRDGDSETILEALVKVSDEGEDLPEEIEEAVFEALDRSVDERGPVDLTWHTRLLQQERVGRAYRQWFVRNHTELILTLAVAGMINPDINTHVRDIVSDDLVDATLSLSLAIPPSPADVDVVNSLTLENRALFEEIMQVSWSKLEQEPDEIRAQKREDLLGWLQVVKPSAYFSPLWSLKVTGDVPPDRLTALANAVESGGLPSSLLVPTAVVVLRNWDRFADRIRKNSAAWDAILKFLPSDYYNVLLPEANLRSGNAADESLLSAARGLKLSRDSLKYLIEQHGFFPQKLAKVAPLLIDLVLRSTVFSNRPQSAADLCACLAARDLPANDYHPSIVEIDQCVRLVAAAKQEGDYLEFARSHWKTATKDWHLILLLKLFPRENLVPSPAQLESLIKHREWLAAHLPERGKNRELFKPATYEFHELDYVRDKRYWRSEFIEGGLWGAFSGVPIRSQLTGKLKKALKVYNPASHLDTSSKMALRYLEGYQDVPDKEFVLVLKKISFEVFFPLLEQLFSDQWEASDVIKYFERGPKQPGTIRSVLASMLPGDELGRKIRQRVGSYPYFERLIETLAAQREGSLSRDYKTFIRQS